MKSTQPRVPLKVSLDRWAVLDAAARLIPKFQTTVLESAVCLWSTDGRGESSRVLRSHLKSWHLSETWWTKLAIEWSLSRAIDEQIENYKAGRPHCWDGKTLPLQPLITGYESEWLPKTSAPRFVVSCAALPLNCTQSERRAYLDATYKNARKRYLERVEKLRVANGIGFWPKPTLRSHIYWLVGYQMLRWNAPWIGKAQKCGDRTVGMAIHKVAKRIGLSLRDTVDFDRNQTKEVISKALTRALADPEIRQAPKTESGKLQQLP